MKLKISNILFILMELVCLVIVLVCFYFMFNNNSNEDSKRVHVILSDSESSAKSALIAGIKDAAAEYGMELVLVSTQRFTSPYEEESVIVREIENGADGIIAESTLGRNVSWISEVSGRTELILLGDVTFKEDNNIIALQPDYEVLCEVVCNLVMEEAKGAFQNKDITFITEGIEKNGNEFLISSIMNKFGDNEYHVIRPEELEDDPNAKIPELAKSRFIIVTDDFALRATEKYFPEGVKVFAVGGSPEAVRLLDTGKISYLICPDDYMRGYDSIRLMNERMNNKKIDIKHIGEDYNKKFTVLTPENMYLEENRLLLYVLSR